jgi:NNP family nitrate/nitrite transporter-like MFS transporter
MFITGFALLACSIMPSLWMIRASMWVLGVGAGMNLPSNMATITAVVSRPDWGKALAVQQMAPPMSLVLGPLLTAALLVWFSWTVPLACIGVLAMVVGLALLRLRNLGDFPGDPPSASLVKTILARRSFWVMVFLFALGMGGQVGIFAMLPLYLVNERGLNADMANTLIGFSQVSALFMTFFAGWVSDRIGERRAIVLFLISSGVATILLGVCSGAWLKLMVFLQPALIVCYFPAGFSALSRIVQPNLRSLTTAWATPTAFILGGGLFPLGLGYMGQAHTFGAGIVLAGCITILGSFLAFSLTLLEKMEAGC